MEDDLFVPDDESKYSKIDYLFSTIPYLKRKNIQLDETALYSVTDGKTADIQSNIIDYICGSSNISVIDGTACVGGNTISFAKRFKEVHAIEICKERAKMLTNNIHTCSLKNVSVYNASFLDIFDTSSVLYTKLYERRKTYDVIFLDPPWGGPEYKKEEYLDLYLGDMNVINIIQKLIERKLSKFIILKAPKNYNILGLEKNIKQRLYIKEQKKMLLISIKIA
jgi:16S rRNA G966 N2-methylase RsmD